MNWLVVALGVALVVALVAAAVLARALMLERSKARLVELNTFDLAAEALDARDSGVWRHCGRVAELSVRLAQQLGLRGQDVEQVRLAGLFHDLGMIGVPDSVLKKAGPLTSEDWTTVARHPDIGADIFGQHPALAGIAPIVRHHTEHWDGSGYPARLKGDSIPPGARIIAVAEAYDTVTNNQIYRVGALTPAEAIQNIAERSGYWYDPDVVNALRMLFG